MKSSSTEDIKKPAWTDSNGGYKGTLTSKSEEANNASQHSFSDSEKQAFSEHINICLSHDPLVKDLLPLDVNSMDLFEKSSNGLILCKLINVAVVDSIDERALNVKPDMNIYQKSENQNLALNAAKAIGCQVVNIGSQDLIEGRPVLVLGLLWQIIKIQLLGLISLKNVPELVLLLQEGEAMASFMKLNPEVILLRWLNYHLHRAGSKRVVKNFTSDLADSEVYSIVLCRLNPSVCSPILEKDPLERGAHAISNAKLLGANIFIKPKDICDASKKLNTTFVAQIFNTCHGLSMEELLEENIQEIEQKMAVLEVDDVGDSREERVLRMWINSLNIDNVYVNDLFSDSDDGITLLKLLDKMSPGSVVWKKINANPVSRFKKVENANYVVQIGKAMKFSLVNVGGIDIVDGNKKVILSIISQMMRRYTLQVLADLATQNGMADITEDQIVQWANDKVMASGKLTKMRSFKDSSLKNSLFLLELVAAIETRAVSWDLVTVGETKEDQMLNAKYVISCARKVGATVFLTPEDVIEVKAKMILTFVASLWTAELASSSSKFRA